MGSRLRMCFGIAVPAATAVAISCCLASAAWAETPDQVPGTKFRISPSALPAVADDQAVANHSEAIPRPEGAKLHVPKGFEVTQFAGGLDDARYLAVMPNGDVLLAEMKTGKITGLRDDKGTGSATSRFVFASGLTNPFGIEFHDGWVYVGDTRAVWRYRWNPADGTAAGSPEQVTPDGAVGGAGGHITRGVAFAPDGKHFYVSIGAKNNIGIDPAPRATIQEFDVSGGQGRTFASGMRNPVDLHFYPGTNKLWTVVNERDGLGDGLVPDYFTQAQDGGFYGWPYSYIGHNKEPGPLGDKRPDLVAKAIVPDVLFQAHSAPLGFVFYTAKQFPHDYDGDAFVSLHGSWNSGTPTGYKIVRVRFRNGKPVGGYENFLTGFWASGSTPAQVWGRPVGLALAKDGSLLIADDVGEAVWRVRWAGK